MKHHIIFSLFVLFVALLATAAHAEKVVTVGIVIDGPVQQAGWSTQLFKNELLTLSKGEVEVRFPESKQLDGAWSGKNIKAAIEQLQNDADVDMVLTLGYVSSSLAVRYKNIQKPTFAPFVLDAELLGLAADATTSGITNLNYLSSEADFMRSLKTFRNVVEFSNIAVIVDQSSYDTQTEAIERVRQVAAKAGLDLKFVLQTKPNEDLAAKLPANTEAVVVTSLPRLGDTTMSKLIDALIEKRIASYSMPGSHLVARGLLMSEAPASDWQRLARRNALNMYAVLKGEAVKDQPVTFKGKRHLTLNMETARAIGLSPSFDILKQAILLNEEPAPSGRSLSLATVAREAVEMNLDLHVAALGLEGSQTEIDRARAQLYPQLGASIAYSQMNDDSLAVTGGFFAEKSTTASLTLSQIIYSDAVGSNVDIQQYLQRNRQALYQQLELDIIQQATVAYLNILKAQTLVHIRRENAELTRTNLKIAQDRQRIGTGKPAEVYRWQSELATAKKELLNAQAQYEQSRDALNRLLHRPLHETFITEIASLDDPNLLVSRKEIFDFIDNDRAFELMGEYMLKQALAASPEMKALDALIAANQTELESSQRAYWSPTVTLQGEVTNTLNEDRQSALSAEGDTDWTVGINASIPLYEGGARSARVTGSRHTLDSNIIKRDATAERVIQRVRATLHQIKASYPSIQLSNEASIAAGKNLQLVTDAYSSGTLTILDLLDAQNAALVAEESATNAVFVFLIDLMNLQRNQGHFDFFLDAPELNERLERLRNYINTEGRSE